jgi:hypothetical protein
VGVASRAPAAEASLLDRLGARHPALAAACRVRPDVDGIGVDTVSWAVDVGLVFDERSASRLRKTRPEQLAARAFVDFRREDALLAAQWVAWAVLFDDDLDERLARAPDGIDAVYADLLSALLGPLGPDDGARDAGPIVTAAAELWRRTVPRAGPAWRRRFVIDLLRHHAVCRQSAEDRLHGRMPDVAEYRRSRQADVGMFMVDLVEPMVRVDVPQAVIDSGPWQAIRGGTTDVLAWCNDITSLPRELARGDDHNYVRVIARAMGLDLADASDWLFERIVERVDDIFVAARALDRELGRLGLDHRTARSVSKVACIYLGSPRGHLEWMHSAGRYSQPMTAATVAEVAG